MATYLKGFPSDAVHDISSAWNLDDQVADFLRWYDENATKLEDDDEWIIDIGFNYRGANSGDRLRVQGETLPVDLMAVCVRHNIAVWLSIYPEITDDRT